MKVLEIDFDDTRVKLVATGQKKRRRFTSGPDLMQFGQTGQRVPATGQPARFV